MPLDYYRATTHDGRDIRVPYYKPALGIANIPVAILPEDAQTAVAEYRDLLSKWSAFSREYEQATGEAARQAALEADRDAMKAALAEGSKTPVKANKNEQQWEAAKADWNVRRSAFIDMLVEAEQRVKDALDDIGSHGVIDRAIEEAERRSEKYRATVDAMHAARSEYEEALGWIRWGVNHSAQHDNTPAVLPAGVKPLPTAVRPTPLDMSAIYADTQRHNRPDVLVSGNKLVNAARRYLYAKQPPIDVDEWDEPLPERERRFAA